MGGSRLYNNITLAGNYLCVQLSYVAFHSLKVAFISASLFRHFMRFIGILNSIIMPYMAPNYIPLGIVLIDFKWKNLPYIVSHIKFASPMCSANFDFIFPLKDFKGIGPNSPYPASCSVHHD